MALIALSEVGVRAPVPPARFDVLQVGITTRCNQVCRHCPRETNYEGFKTMPLETFTRALDRFDPKQFDHLIVSDFVEVTIVPAVLDYLRSARTRGFVGLHFVTNATRRDRRFWQAIADERLVDFIYASTEAASDPLYQAMRGHSFAHLRSVLDMIAGAFGSAAPRIPFRLGVTCMRLNLPELPRIIDLAAEVGAAQVDFVHLNPTNYANRSASKLCVGDQHLDQVDRATVIATFREVRARALALGVPIELPEAFPELTGSSPVSGPEPAEPPEFLCRRPFQWVQIGIEGEVRPCCQISHRYHVGNVFERSFSALWQGEGYRRLMDGLRPGGEPIAPCRACNVFNGKRF